jgi:hypothetical protein
MLFITKGRDHSCVYLALPFTLGYHYYQIHLIVKKKTQRIFKRVPEPANQKKMKGERLIKSVSSVIGGWARCAPSPTTRVAGHDVAAA